MARSGRGRGRTAFTFNIEAIGFAKGEVLPETVLGPSPLYPTTDFKPMPLKTGEDEDYLLALKQEFRASMKRTPYFVAQTDEDQGVEKYSKKYLQTDQEDLEWTPDWRRLPREMKPRKKIKRAGGKLKKAKTTASKIAASKTNVDVLKKIEDLEKKGDEEKSDEEEKEKKKERDKEDEEEGEEPEEYDEEEHEEENDYIASYFEDGDDYAADSDDNMDEATY
ncbi:DNA-directed RNA polymerase III subunit RPC7 isoform X1 [Hemicordylus capensis]|uniref:DNA-directed RNA polymerase III subunit RPC7 isoform X1 n=1 Tax=Hemicordylus capensis TaxID=884348 RepID=UPI002302A43E|nr:DNA-directed RNA polymerase III subunit RPC7 isoform X1 [Hemicordylus capensis]XP_053160031.1 DNA-directed RNA polymerase III subunit RPC7 isoform X1 [Hemicordylus capensis]